MSGAWRARGGSIVWVICKIGLSASAACQDQTSIPITTAVLTELQRTIANMRLFISEVQITKTRPKDRVLYFHLPVIPLTCKKPAARTSTQKRPAWLVTAENHSPSRATSRPSLAVLPIALIITCSKKQLGGVGKKIRRQNVRRQIASKRSMRRIRKKM